MSFLDYPRVHRRRNSNPMWELIRSWEAGEECMCAERASAPATRCGSGIIASWPRYGVANHERGETLPYRENPLPRDADRPRLRPDQAARLPSETARG